MEAKYMYVFEIFHASINIKTTMFKDSGFILFLAQYIRMIKFFVEVWHHLYCTQRMK